MLKIKDNVDLKELEKFGFKKYETINEYYRKGTKVTDGYQTFFERFEIGEDDRIIRTVLYNDLSDQYWEGTVERVGRVIDLDKAGLVEEIKPIRRCHWCKQVLYEKDIKELSNARGYGYYIECTNCKNRNVIQEIDLTREIL